MSKIASHYPFQHLQPKLWAKERPGVKLSVWLPTTKSRESTSPWGVRHGVEKLSTRAITLLQNSSQSKVGAKSYGRPKSRVLQPHFGQVWGWSPTLGKVGGLVTRSQVPGWNTLEGFTKSSCGKLNLVARSRLPTLEGGRGSSWEPRD